MKSEREKRMLLGDMFEILSRGGFISANHPGRQKLYEALETEFDWFKERFEDLHLRLEEGKNFYFLAKTESPAQHKKKVEVLVNYLDYLAVVMELSPGFAEGFRFSFSEWTQAVEKRRDRQEKIIAMPLATPGESPEAVLQKILKELHKAGFIYLENEAQQQYKVLSSFNYLQSLFLNAAWSDEPSEKTINN